jgi:plastocyanin
VPDRASVKSIGRRRRLTVSLLATVSALLAFAAPASADDEILGSPTYADMTIYSCRTEAITIYPGQNLNLFAATKTCPNAQKLMGPGDTSVFARGSTAQGYVTRFKPSMVEIKPDGSLVTPSVWDLHLHHVVWLGPNGPTFASGEEKTVPKLPQGYGFKTGGDANWGLNYMIHNLTADGGRQIYITWEIEWVPETTPARTDIKAAVIQWLDVAGAPQVYPVFDAERGFDTNGDGEYVFPDEVPSDPAVPGYEEASKVSSAGSWTVPGAEGVARRTLVFGAGHLHPGGLHVDLQVARDGPDAGSVDGDDPSEIRPLFRSDAHYYEPAGAVSWDVSMEATRPDWRISLQGGDTVSIDATYDVRKSSWYESMGILPLAVSTNTSDPLAKDPFNDEAAVKAMYDEGGILTHGRLPENVDFKANKDLKLADPRKLHSKGRVPRSGLEIDGFGYSAGGYSAFRGFPQFLLRPPVINPGQSVTFTNIEALPTMSDEQQVWHSVTSCSAPCNRGAGIGYPLAGGPIKFDSGQLGYGTGTSTQVTTGSNVYTTPPLTKPGKTYTYFCRIHPFMRGSIRVRGNKRHKPNGPGHRATLG